MRIVRKSSLVPAPWKNGGGITHEVMRCPPGDGPFLWRVSIAQIDASGPFSDFDGYRRTMLLLQGEGLRLTFNDASVRDLRDVGDMVEFDGAAAPDCHLSRGPCTDFNLMVSHRVDSAGVGVVRLSGPRPLVQSDQGPLTHLAFPIEGHLSVVGEAGATVVLAPWDFAVISADDPMSVVAPVPGDTAPLVFFAALTDN